MRILVGVDLTRPDFEPLVRRAAWFAGVSGGTVDLAFVAPVGAPNEVETYRGRLARLLEQLPAEHRGEALVAMGDPVAEIVVASARYDALVVGPRDPGVIGRLLLGSISAKVIQRARCSVLIPRGHRDEARPRRLLVGVDVDADAGEWVVREGGRWAERLGARLDAVYADPEGPPYVPDARFREAARRQWAAALEPQRQTLEELLRFLPPEQRGEARLAAGGPEEALVDLSADYDFVLVGTRSRPGWTGLLLGSVSEFVVRNAKCDVLTLHTASEFGSS